LQYFKIVTPKRKYYKNTCQWKYKGEECQYPGSGGLPIPSSDLVSNANPIAANNEIANTEAEDVCSKSLEGCTLRNNARHFGGFPGTGRTVPRA
jgi:lambda family phage minor tail protein L